MSDELKEPTFEESLRRLEEIVATLEGGRADLETSLRRYEEGVRLLRQCRQKLDRAERRIEIVKKIDAVGNFFVEPIDAAELKSDESTPGRQTEKSVKEKKSTPKSKKPRESAENAASSDDVSSVSEKSEKEKNDFFNFDEL